MNIIRNDQLRKHLDQPHALRRQTKSPAKRGSRKLGL